MSSSFVVVRGKALLVQSFVTFDPSYRIPDGGLSAFELMGNLSWGYARL